MVEHERLDSIRTGIRRVQGIVRRLDEMTRKGIYVTRDYLAGKKMADLAPSGAEVLTVEFKISLLAPADGLRFLATAAVLRAGKRLSFCSGEVRAIRESSEELIATMLSTIITKTA